MSNLAKEIITIAIPTAMPIAIGMMALKMSGGDWRDRDHHGDRDDRYALQYTRVRVERDYYSQPGFPLLQIILGIDSRQKRIRMIFKSSLMQCRFF